MLLKEDEDEESLEDDADEYDENSLSAKKL